MERRQFVKTSLAAGTTALAVAATGSMAGAASAEAGHDASDDMARTLKGNVNHSVCKWCYSEMSVEELAVSTLR